MQKLPFWPLQLGHSHAGAGTRQTPEPRHRLQTPGKPAVRMAARDQGNDGRHGNQLNREPEGKPLDAARRGAEREGAWDPWH